MQETASAVDSSIDSSEIQSNWENLFGLNLPIHPPGSWAPTLFSNLENSVNSNEKVVDAALCSSAAPTYFPSHKQHIDGGIFANNPVAIAMALGMQGKFVNISNFNEVCILSVALVHHSLHHIVKT